MAKFPRSLCWTPWLGTEISNRITPACDRMLQSKKWPIIERMQHNSREHVLCKSFFPPIQTRFRRRRPWFRLKSLRDLEVVLKSVGNRNLARSAVKHMSANVSCVQLKTLFSALETTVTWLDQFSLSPVMRDQQVLSNSCWWFF